MIKNKKLMWEWIIITWLILLVLAWTTPMGDIVLFSIHWSTGIYTGSKYTYFMPALIGYILFGILFIWNIILTIIIRGKK